MTTDTLPQWADQLLALLDEQAGLYEQLETLGQRQSAVVDRGDTEALLEILGQRQRMIDQLVGLNGKLDPYKRRWSELWPQLEPDQQAHVRRKVDRVQDMLDQLLQRDERDRAALAGQQQQIKRQLDQVNRGSQVNRAYGAPAGGGSSPRFTDRTG